MSTWWISTPASKLSQEKSGLPSSLQSDLVTQAGYPSTIVVPTTTQLVENAGLLRLRLKRGVAGLERDSDALVGQLIAVANESFTRELGTLPVTLLQELEQRVRIILGF